MELDRRRIVAYRLAAQGLAERGRSLEQATAGWAVQESPPGASPVALHARVEGFSVEDLDRALLDDRTLVLVPNPRSANALIPASDLPAFVAALRPPDDEALHFLVRSSLEDDAIDPRRAAELVTAATLEALDGRVLSRQELHDEYRRLLPGEVLPWCSGCQSHHVRRGLIGAAVLEGALCLAGRPQGKPGFTRPDQWLGGAKPTESADPQRELVRRYLHAYAPSTPKHFAQWAGVSPAHARALWATAESDVAEASHPEAGRAWALSGDLDALADPPPSAAVRLLAQGDPFLLARDRKLLVTDDAGRKSVWTAIGGAGLLIAGDDIAGTWRGRKRARKLEVTLDPFTTISAKAERAAREEAEAIAKLRNCTSLSVTIA